MIESVRKRNGTIVPFNKENIEIAVNKAIISTHNQEDRETAKKVADRVSRKLSAEYKEESPTVDEIHVLVENKLMDMKLYDIAREYISYRDRNKPDIFRKRVNIKPYEYPDLVDYGTAIQHSYWLFSEFNYTSDVQDIKANLTEQEKTVMIRAMLAISQVEAKVKTFWSDIHMHIPKPEVAKVGAIIGENEVRHGDSYSNLLELLGLNNEFEKLQEVPAIQNRIAYLQKALEHKDSDDPREYFESIILFSTFIENISLFSQFLIILSFNKHRNYLKGMSNVVESSSIEEDIHARFGFDLIDIIKQENPGWWNESLIERIRTASMNAYDAEMSILDWIYEEGDIEVVPKRLTQEFIKHRMNKSMTSLDIEPFFQVDESLIEQTDWFEDEVMTTKNVDFFNKRSNAYTKRTQSVTAEDLF